MVEESQGLERKTKDKIKPSDVRPQAHYYELVRFQYPKAGKKGHYLYWWDKDSKEVVLEEVNVGGMRFDDTPLVRYKAESAKSARHKITENVNAKRKKGLKMVRHQTLDRELFNEGRIKQATLIPFYSEMIRGSSDNLSEARWDYDNAKRRAEEKKESEKFGKVYRRKSVIGGLSLEDQVEKRKHDLETAIDEYYPDLKFYNQYLNDTISVEGSAADDEGSYGRYIKSNEELSNLHSLIRKARPLEDKNELVKEYEEVFKNRLDIYHKLAEERGFPPLKGIPEEFPIGKKPEIKKEKVKKVDQVEQVVEEEDSKEKPLEVKLKIPPTDKILPPPKEDVGVHSEIIEETENKKVPVKVEKSKTQKEKTEEVEEIKDIGEALSASAKGLKEKGSYTFALKGSGAEELVKGIIPQFKEVWEQQGIKIANFSIDADIKPDAGQIEIDVKVKKSVIEKRIQATLKIESKDGVLNTTQVSANKIRVMLKSYNVQEMIEENIGGKKIHSIIDEWFASEMDARGAKLENVEFRFTPENKLRVRVEGEAK